MKLRRLRRKRDQPFVPIALPPDEWDFRRLSENELHLCIHYEYARTADWFRKLVETWLDSPFPDWKEGTRVVSRLSGERETIFLDRKITVRDALRKKRGGEIWDKLLAEMPRRITDADAAAWVLSAVEFPLPYLSCRRAFPEWVKQNYDPAHRHEVRRAFEIVEEFPARSRAEDYFHRPGTEDETKSARGFQLDFRQGKRTIEKQFATWLDSTWPNRIPKVPLRGKRTHCHWAKLKRLAAFRLITYGGFHVANADQNYERLNKYLADNPVRRAIPHDVLPFYSSPGRWHDAEREAIALAAKLYPQTGGR